MESIHPTKKETVQEDHCCSVCLDVFYKPVILRICGHIFCQNCLHEIAIITENRKCPLCRTNFTQEDMRSEDELWKLMQKMYPRSLETRIAHLKERVMMSLVIGNTTEILNVDNDNKYKWELYVKSVEGQQTLAKYVDRVDIELHPTFRPPTIQFKVKNNQPIRVARYGWGTFRIGITVYWKDHFNEKFTNFHHDLEFQPVHERIANTLLTVKKR